MAPDEDTAVMQVIVLQGLSDKIKRLLARQSRRNYISIKRGRGEGLFNDWTEEKKLLIVQNDYSK